jgi:hypothetical protein
MPVCERDPWRFQFFEGVVCPADVRVPTDDLDCYDWFPEWRWVYHKRRIAESQGLPHGDHSTLPSAFPVFAKPDVNLRGMGLNSSRIESESEFKNRVTEGMMWMPFFEGEHISSDAAIVDGQCVWLRHALGEPWIDGMFKHWTIEVNGREALSAFLATWIASNMRGYTGMMNFETIGGHIIEAHLRFADQWCDIYGKDWIDALVTLYAQGHWIDSEADQRVGYSVPLFTRHGFVPQHPSAEQQAAIRAMPSVSSLQITFYPAKAGEAHPMPPGGFRLGIINCWDLDAGFAARRAYAACFPNSEIMIPE